jgi:hypothetical protein
MTRRPSPSWIPDEIMKQLMPVLSKQILDELMIYIVKHTEALGNYSGELAETVEDVKPRVRNLYRMKMESKDVMEEVADIEREMEAEMKRVDTMQRVTEGRLWDFEQAKQNMETAEMTSAVEDMKKRTKLMKKIAFGLEQMIEILVENVELSDEEMKRKAKELGL